MSKPDQTSRAVAPQRVTFPDLVRIHFRWRRVVADGSPASDAERDAATADYHAALTTFEDEHGQIVNAYWCANYESAVALTAGRPRTGWLRRLLSVAPKFHRVSDWATREDPGVARLLHECDELALRATEVLRGRSRRVCIQLVMTSACHLLSLIDAREARPAHEEHRASIAAEKRRLELVAKGYRQAANSDAQLVYFAGVAVGGGLLALLYVAAGGLLRGESIENAAIIGSLVAGALGALVSVIARVNSGSFDLDSDVARGYTLFLGALRPLIGSIFGVLTYFAVTSGFVEFFKVPGDGVKHFYFLCVIAFGAGFSERWAQDTLTGGLTGRGRTPATEPDAQPAAKPPPAHAAAKPQHGATGVAGSGDAADD